MEFDGSSCTINPMEELLSLIQEIRREPELANFTSEDGSVKKRSLCTQELSRYTVLFYCGFISASGNGRHNEPS